MKSNIPKIIHLFTLLLLISITVYSQPKHKEYSCYRAPHKIVVDGDVYNEEWKSIPWSEFFEDIEGDVKPKPYYQTRMKMLWDDNYLYIAAELEDPHIWAYLNKHDNIVYRDNDFEVFIDPTNDGLNYFEIEINSLETILDLFMEKPYNKRGKPDLKWNAKGLNKAVKIYGSNNDTLVKDIKWTIELAIPWTAYNNRVTNLTKPKSGDTWHMNFSRVQWETEFCDNKYKKKTSPNTEKPLPENNWVWSPQGVINMHVPEHWGNVTFVDEVMTYSQQIRTEDNFPKYWVWMSGNNKTTFEWEKVFRKLDDIGIKGFLFGGGPEQLSLLIPIANQYDIDVHAWFWTMNRGDAKPEWLSVNQLGKSLADEKAYVNYYKFMCPALPEVVSFLKTKMGELAMVKGLSGIHMDYIRYVDVILPVGLQPKYGLVQDHIMPEFDYGYHPYMRKLFEEKYGTDPMDLPDPGTNVNWVNHRLNELNKTVGELRDYVKENNLNITAAVFPTPAMSADMVRQDWSDWNLNCYFPMVYHNFYNENIDWIKNIVKEDKRAVGKNSKVFCGLYLPGLQNGNDVTSAIKAAFDGGADGISFFSYGNLTDDVASQIKNYKENN